MGPPFISQKFRPFGKGITLQTTWGTYSTDHILLPNGLKWLINARDPNHLRPENGMILQVSPTKVHHVHVTLALADPDWGIGPRAVGQKCCCATTSLACHKGAGWNRWIFEMSTESKSKLGWTKLLTIILYCSDCSWNKWVEQKWVWKQLCFFFGGGGWCVLLKPAEGQF